MSVRSRKLNLYKKIVKEAEADQHGIFNVFQGAYIKENTRDKYLEENYNKPPDRSFEGLYNLTPNHEDVSLASDHIKTGPLSTRYAPGFPGVQSRRIGDGVVQNPITGQIFDYNEGFKLGDMVYNPGDVSLQTSLLHTANHLDELGLTKEADIIDGLIKKISKY